MSYELSEQLVALDLQTGFAVSEGIDTLISVENAVGGTGNDSLLGSTVANRLYGLGGNDRMDGRGGNDTLVGGHGSDIMKGGAGADRFIINDKKDFWWGYDTITDFQKGIDKIDLSRIDARPDHAGNQAFTFGSTPDGWLEEWKDGLSDWAQGGVRDSVREDEPGPVINGDVKEIEYRHADGKTYVYVSTGDYKMDASFVLDGTIHLTASDFIL